MTEERFKLLWAVVEVDSSSLLKEALTAFIHAEAMREKAEFYGIERHRYNLNICERCKESQYDSRHDFETDADWLKASWEKWLGRMP